MHELLLRVPLPLLIIIGIMVFISLFVIGYSYLRNRTLDQIRADVYQLMLKAEHTYKESPSGKQKMKWVVQQARKLLPKWLRELITEEFLEYVIQVWFDEIKDLLDDGKVNGSKRIEGA